MNFVSREFLAFLVVVFFLYWHLGHKNQNRFLVLASSFFYACWDWRFLGVIWVAAIIQFICGARIDRASSQAQRRFWLIVSLASNLGLLGYFKYFNFFIGSFTSLVNTIGWGISPLTLNITLPVGISFFTFETLSYSLDIYARRTTPTRSFVDFLVFATFFPRLAAGPIVRAQEFVFQVEKPREFNGGDLQEGMTRFLFGFFKKAFVADILAMNLVDPVFASPEKFTASILWLAMVGYAVQIYADFSGYSSMAIGLGRMLGFIIPENFLFPYLATNFSDFWRRWHVTMSRFFRDYVYIQLGGNRGGRIRTLVNLAMTTLVSGLWHGAGWTFIVWGGLHGLYIMVNHLWAGRERASRPTREGGLLQALPAWLLTQSLVCLAWILFRAQDFPTAWEYLSGLLIPRGTETIALPPLVWLAFLAFVADHAFGWLLEHRPRALERVPDLEQALLYADMVVFLYHAIPENPNPFIYFQF
jgi:D-alanyl-lipoteichoic acid acyltransferase DltB (MBOAT superfamily)